MKFQLTNLPTRTNESQIRTALSPLGRVQSVSLSGSTCTVEMDSPTTVRAIDSSGIGEIRLGDLAQIDSSGIGELTAAKISVIR